jgi:hypothetical protein
MALFVAAPYPINKHPEKRELLAGRRAVPE